MIERSAKDWMLLPLRRYAEFSGRSPRAEYWWFILFSILISIPATILDVMMGSQIVGGLLTLTLLLPSFAVSVRRLHDLDRSGWWAIAPGGAFLAAGIFGSIAGPKKLNMGETSIAEWMLYGSILVAVLICLLLLVWYCMRGAAGPNRFGEDPLAEPSNPTQYYG